MASDEAIWANTYALQENSRLKRAEMLQGYSLKDLLRKFRTVGRDRMLEVLLVLGMRNRGERVELTAEQYLELCMVWERTKFQDVGKGWKKGERG